MRIKICGITRPEEAEYLNENRVDYAGFVFYGPSKRNVSIETAERIAALLLPDIKKVAVTVSPSADDIRRIQEAGFADILQIHKELRKESVKEATLPVWYALNLPAARKPSDALTQILQPIEALPDELHERITGLLADAPQFGSGKTFDWKGSAEMFKAVAESPPDGIKRLLILAGGLNSENVPEGISTFRPDIVDVSSGVEGNFGKDRNMIAAFVKAARGEMR